MGVVPDLHPKSDCPILNASGQHIKQITGTSKHTHYHSPSRNIPVPSSSTSTQPLCSCRSPCAQATRRHGQTAYVSALHHHQPPFTSEKDHTTGGVRVCLRYKVSEATQPAHSARILPRPAMTIPQINPSNNDMERFLAMPPRGPRTEVVKYFLHSRPPPQVAHRCGDRPTWKWTHNSTVPANRHVTVCKLRGYGYPVCVLKNKKSRDVGAVWVYDLL